MAKESEVDWNIRREDLTSRTSAAWSGQDNLCCVYVGSGVGILGYQYLEARNIGMDSFWQSREHVQFVSRQGFRCESEPGTRLGLPLGSRRNLE